MDIISTLGPACSSESVIEKLAFVSGRFRLNTSHLTPALLEEWLEKLEAIYKRIGKSLPVVIDLQGAKMRVAPMDEPFVLKDRVRIVVDPRDNDSKTISVPHPRLFKALKPQERLVLDDAKLEIEVISVDESELEAKVIRGGTLLGNKGINRAEHPIAYTALSKRDREMIECARQYAFTEYAFSFVFNGSEAELLRAELPKQKLIAKIERNEAFDHLESITSLFDELWLCRGDLGAQAGLFNLYQLQKRFVTLMAKSNRPYVLAGQVLEHLRLHCTPTRAEIVALAEAEDAGFSGFVLSDETAMGERIDSLVDFLALFRQRGNKSA